MNLRQMINQFNTPITYRVVGRSSREQEEYGKHKAAVTIYNEDPRRNFPLSGPDVVDLLVEGNQILIAIQSYHITRILQLNHECLNMKQFLPVVARPK